MDSEKYSKLNLVDRQKLEQLYHEAGGKIEDDYIIPSTSRDFVNTATSNMIDSLTETYAIAGTAFVNRIVLMPDFKVRSLGNGNAVAKHFVTMMPSDSKINPYSIAGAINDFGDGITAVRLDYKKVFKEGQAYGNDYKKMVEAIVNDNISKGKFVDISPFSTRQQDRFHEEQQKILDNLTEKSSGPDNHTNIAKITALKPGFDISIDQSATIPGKIPDHVFLFVRGTSFYDAKNLQNTISEQQKQPGYTFDKLINSRDPQRTERNALTARLAAANMFNHLRESPSHTENVHLNGFEFTVPPHEINSVFTTMRKHAQEGGAEAQNCLYYGVQYPNSKGGVVFLKGRAKGKTWYFNKSSNKSERSGWNNKKNPFFPMGNRNVTDVSCSDSYSFKEDKKSNNEFKNKVVSRGSVNTSKFINSNFEGVTDDGDSKYRAVLERLSEGHTGKIDLETLAVYSSTNNREDSDIGEIAFLASSSKGASTTFPITNQHLQSLIHTHINNARTESMKDHTRSVPNENAVYKVDAVNPDYINVTNSVLNSLINHNMLPPESTNIGQPIDKLLLQHPLDVVKRVA
jgi:hypothetical protein